MARNLQLILLEESNIYRVSDPNAGSGGIEAITHELCAAAWQLFQEIEAKGGAAAALDAGLIQKKVAEARAAREKNIATRKDLLTGTSEFANLHEAAATVLDVPKPALPARHAAAQAEALPRIRLAEPFEKLRDAAERAGENRPAVFLANLGMAADFTPRASFAKNFFEAGGVAALSNDGFMSADALAAAFKASDAKIACLCSSDELYGREAETAAKALKQSGAKAVYLAGRPGEHQAAWEKAGVNGFIYAGSDVLAALQQIHAILDLK
jgi:methylmalonyl-CoA mutase